MTPAEIHQTGLDIIKDHSARIDAIMKTQGLTKGSVGERLRAMYSDPKYHYPNTDAGKETLISLRLWRDTTPMLFYPVALVRLS